MEQHTPTGAGSTSTMTSEIGGEGEAQLLEGERDDYIGGGEWLSKVQYRQSTPTDIAQCYLLERASYTPSEAASKNDLRYCQHHAAPFFRCAVLETNEDDHDAAAGGEEETVIGYICGTRCEPQEDDSVTYTHKPDVSSLIVHSMVIRDEYQNQGLGKHMMKDYIDSVLEFNMTNEKPISRILLFVRESLLVFYLHCGFSIIRPSRLENDGEGIRYLIERKMSHRVTERQKIIKAGGVDCFLVDSFADAAGTGNPAAVVFLPRDTQADAMAKWMHTVAAEFNQSETAFCWPSSDPAHNNNSNNISSTSSATTSDEHWNIRYYTPKVEIPLCGHATLASAAILYQTLKRSDDYRIVFHAAEDDLIMERATPTGTDEHTSFRTRISMNFPSKPPREVSTHEDKLTIEMMLQSAFSCSLDNPLYVGISDTGDILVELKPENFHAIGYEHINFKALMEWDGYYRGVIVCCSGDSENNNNNNNNNKTYDSSSTNGGELTSQNGSSSLLFTPPDFMSRFFCPKAGINEDPVTGSAHCVLGPYYSQKLGKDMVVGKQMSERGGMVECLVQDNQVRLTGTAVTTMTGTLWMKKEETVLVPRLSRGRSHSINCE